MKNNLTTTNQNAKLVLSKSKSLLSTLELALSKDDKWIKKLFKWADENYIPDFGAEKIISVYELYSDFICSK